MSILWAFVCVFTHQVWGWRKKDVISLEEFTLGIGKGVGKGEEGPAGVGAVLKKKSPLLSIDCG